MAPRGRAGRPWKPVRGDHEETRELARWLRAVKARSGLTLRDLEQRTRYGRDSISRRINGERRPDWDFVEAFVHACSATDLKARPLLIDEARRLWQAADPVRTRLPAPGAPKDSVSGAFAVANESGQAVTELAMGIRALAESQGRQTRTLIAVTRHQAMVTGLLTMVQRLHDAAVTLTSERDALRDQLRDLDNAAEQLAAAQRQLAETQLRLEQTERLQRETNERLDTALAQLKEAERLRDEATRQAQYAHQQLAEVRQIVQRPTASTDSSIPPDVAEQDADLMNDDDQRAAITILASVDSLLEEEARNLRRLGGDLSGSTGSERMSTRRNLHALSGELPGDIVRQVPDNPDDGGLARTDNIQSKVSSQRIKRETPAQPGRSGRPPAVWGGKIPQRNRSFAGRDDMLDRLRSGHEGMAVAFATALYGMGGVGKTQIAIEYIYRYRSDYDLVWWIPADQPVLVRTSLASLAPHLGLPPASATGVEEAATAVLDALRRGDPFTNWLLIFDNADQPQEINDIVPRGPGHVLITTRNHRWQGVVAVIPVEVFSRTESVAFLKKRVSTTIKSQDADSLAQELGDLPLALEQAGALQAETGMRVEEYLSLLKEQTSKLLAEGRPSEYPASMTAAWQISVSRLGDKLPQAVDLLRCFAFFGAEPIPRAVFRAGSRAAESKLKSVLDDPILLSRTIRELGRFALSKIDPSTGTIQVHRLIQALVRDDLAAKERDWFRHEVHLLLVGAALTGPARAGARPRDPDDISNWQHYSELVAHVVSSNLAGCQDPAARRLALNIVRYLHQSGNHHFARSFAENLRAQWITDAGEDHPDLLLLQWNLGNVLRELGEYGAAYELDSVTLERIRVIVGPGHEVTLAAAIGFGADLRARGEFASARELDEDSRRNVESALGAGHLLTLRAVNNLALDYCMNSNYGDARTLYLKAYRQQQAERVSRLDVFTSWIGLSRAARLCGDYPNACEVGGGAYAYAAGELGPDHFLTLQAATDLSIAQRLAGRRVEALELARNGYERCKRLFGEIHPATLAAAIGLANTLRTMGEIDAAFELTKNTMAQYPKVYGKEHPYNYACVGNLALLQRLHGDAANARALNQTSLNGLDAKLTRDHHYALTVAINLASDLAVLGETAAARALGEDTFLRLQRVLGENHPITLGCAANLVIDLKADGADERSAELAEDVLSRYSRILGLDHPDTEIASSSELRLDFDFDPLPI